MGMDIYGASGNYFRANVWSWRPIHAIIEAVNAESNLGLDLTNFGTNDGAGLHSQEDCDRLADAMEKHIGDAEVFELESTLRVSDSGQFLKLGEQGGRSAYSTDREHVKEFITFLRECGGSFNIN